jgi:hypothetical protein
MNEGDFKASLRTCQSSLSDLKILQQLGSYGSLAPSDEFKREALDPDVNYSRLYQIGLRNKDYNFLLSDFSFLQFYFARGSEVCALRYAYYPNPFKTISFSSFLEMYGVEEYEPDSYESYLQYLSEVEQIRQVPVLRYDVADERYEELIHPTAHFHLGLLSDNRLPADRILTPHAFGLFVAKHFYGDAWQELGQPSNPAQGNLNEFDRRYCEEKRRCSALGAHLFSMSERNQLFLT